MRRVGYPSWLASRVDCLVDPLHEVANVDLESGGRPVRFWFLLFGGNYGSMWVLSRFDLGFVWFCVGSSRFKCLRF